MSAVSQNRLPALLEALRPRQWIKNGFVFAAPLFAFTLEVETLAVVGAAFLVFCAISSATYLVNDLFDLEEDRLHPVKRKRPLASGRIRSSTALVVALGLGAVATVSAFWLSRGLAGVVVAYLGVQIAYNLILKHLLILDIMALATGFVLRAVAGGVVARVELSPWFLFCIALLAFYLGLEKRKSELTRVDRTGVNTRPILSSYSRDYVSQIETAVLACILMAYALWTIQGAPTAWMMLTAPFVLYGILRYQYLSVREIVERPEEALFRDRPLLTNVVLWVLACFAILALRHLGRLG